MIHEDKNIKLFNLTFSTPSEIIISKIGDTTLKKVNQVLCKNLTTINVKLKSEIMEKINFAENMRNLLKTSTKRDINYLDISSDLI